MANQASSDFMKDVSAELMARCAVNLNEVMEVCQIVRTEQPNMDASQYASHLIEVLNLMEIKVSSRFSRGDVRTYNNGRLALASLANVSDKWRMSKDGFLYAETPSGTLRLDVANMDKTLQTFKLGFRISEGQKLRLEPLQNDEMGRVKTPTVPFHPVSEALDLDDVIAQVIGLKRSATPKPLGV